MKQKAVSSTYIKTFLQCHQKFYYQYVDKKLPVKTGDARAFGIAVHEALEQMYVRMGEKGGLPTEDDYKFVYDVFLGSAVDNGLIAQELYDEGRDILKVRLDSFDPDEKVLGLELKFGFRDSKIQVKTSNGTPLIGAIDKVVELDDDTLVVIDYKTSRTALTDSQAATDEQLSLYDLVVSKLFPQYKNIIVALDYLRLSPVVTHRTPKQRKDFEEFVDKIYQRIGEMDESEVKPVLNEFCGWCDYKAYCSKYNDYINDKDLISKPLGNMSKKEFVEEWERFSRVKRIVDSHDRDLKMFASNVAQGDKSVTIVGDTNVLSQYQRSSVYYNVKILLDSIPKKDQVDLVSVKKKALDKYIADRPEYADALSKDVRVLYQSPYFRLRKKTKKDGD